MIGLVGALVEVPAGSSAQAGPLCVQPVRAPRGEQQQDATLEYRRIWRRAAPLLGSAGQPPPRLRFVGPDAKRPGSETPTWTGPDKSNCRTIFIAPGARRLLARSDGDLRTRRRHRAALRWAIHETAHYFQSDDVLSSPSLREYGATEWEKAHSPMLLGTRKKRDPVPFNQWRDRDQFGANYGGNPQTFIWPTEAPRARTWRLG
ncbi:MAG: hypothetical protein ACM31K_06355 [Solirubrobacterales bacterium]